jgi:hypothetical protein
LLQAVVVADLVQAEYLTVVAVAQAAYCRDLN